MRSSCPRIPTTAILLTAIHALPSYHAFFVHVAPIRPPSFFQVTSSDSTTAPAGVSEFDAWFQTIPKADCSPKVKHSSFQGLRGLSWEGDLPVDQSSKVVTIPATAVLSSNYEDPNWDAVLAVSIWNEVSQGRSSTTSGYCSLLTQGPWLADGNCSCPPSTAPHALRRWTPSEKAQLESTLTGQKLLEAARKQEVTWREKYDSIVNDRMSWEQFQWAMEAVHSRAFRGLSADNSVNVPALAAPVVAAAAGWIYTHSTPFASETVLLGLAVAAVLPTLLSLVSPSPSSAVLLPLIDSANHLQEADSSIDYDPIKKVYELSIGSNCLVRENDDQVQVYISYGTKGDGELLLNYGFLPGVGVADDDTEARTKLAEAFAARQN